MSEERAEQFEAFMTKWGKPHMSDKVVDFLMVIMPKEIEPKDADNLEYSRGYNKGVSDFWDRITSALWWDDDGGVDSMLNPDFRFEDEL